jgi:hypothetical protein
MVLCAVLAALAIRLIVMAFVYSDFLQPGRDHWEFGYEMGRMARSVAEGRGFGNPYWMTTGPSALIPPVYPYLIAGIFKVFGINTKASALVILSLNSLFSALTCIPIFLVARKIVGEGVAKWATWLWAFFPYAVYFPTNTMWYHGLVGLLLAWQVWMVLRLEQSAGIAEWIGFGALSGFAAMTDPATLGILPILIGWTCYRLHQRRQRWFAPAVTACAVVVLAVTPWMVRNYEVFHKPVFLRDGLWLEVYVGNVGNSLHWWNGDIHPAGSVEEQNEYVQLGELGYMNLKKQQSIAYIKSHPGTFVVRSIRRAVFFWTGFWSLNRAYLQEEPMDRINFFFLFPTTMLMLFSLRKLFREAPAQAVLIGLLLLVFPLPYYFTHPDLTYREPLEPLVALLVAYAVAPASARATAEESSGFAKEDEAYATT